MKRTTMLVLAVLAGMAVQHCIAGEMGDDALADGGGTAQVFEGRFKGGNSRVACDPRWATTPPTITTWEWNDVKTGAVLRTVGIALDAAGCLTIGGGTPGAPYQVVIR